MNQEKILQSLEKRLPNYEKFEELILENIHDNYFSLVYQSIYNQLGYEKFNGKFTTDQFKELLVENDFLRLVNDIYRTRLSNEGLEETFKRLLEVEDFDDYQTVLQKFQGCNPVNYKGKVIKKNAFSLGTKLLHYYNPKENAILDTNVIDNLKLGEINLELCLEFKKATNIFVKNHTDYFDKLYASPLVLKEFEKRYMKCNFPKMEIIDMALYWPKDK